MKSKEITLGGILVALTTIILYLAVLLPISKVSILTIASAVVPICIIRANVKTATFVYIASSIICFFIIPMNIWLLYVLVFGGYGIIKYFIERMRKGNLEILLKVVYFNIIIFTCIILAKWVIGIDVIQLASITIRRYIEIDEGMVIYIIFWIAAQILFYLFDYALTLIITFYMDRFHKKY